MKKAGLFLLILFLSCNFAWSQDTLYIYRAGIVVVKRAVSEIDSVTFSKNYNLPVLETVTDLDGNVYHAVKIGTQIWMAENLKTTKYNDGTPIPLVTDGYSWTITSNAAYTWVNNNSTYISVYGGIYNFYAASSGKLAPKGWHVPTKAEIDTLATYLGGYPVAGSKLKEAGNAHWISSNSDATNSSGFTALPAGYRSSATGDFHNSGAWGVFWSSTEFDGKGGRLIMESISAKTDYSFDNKLLGFSVRCIKDSQTLPVLTTTGVSAITDTTAISGGNITSDGGAAITARGICWSTSQNPTIDGSKTTDSIGIGAFTSKITELTADSIYYVRAYATNSVGTAYGEQVSFKTLQTLLQTVTDIDGNVYHTVKIGTQTWMVENLKTTHYRNGNPIPNVTDNNTWASSYSGAYCWYNNDIQNKDTLGALYNGYTVKDSRNIAPIGWHVPSKEEWILLINYLGGENVAGGKMKENGTTHWISPNSEASNESGFNALPGGYRAKDTGTFQYKGTTAFYRTSSEEVESGYDSSWHIMLFNQNANITPSYAVKVYGFSVRCVKDAQTLPVLTTTAVSAITDTTAISGGNITSDGGAAITARGICWSTSQNPTIDGSKTTDSIGIGAFTSKITGLTADSIYYVRAYATNSVGTAYGNQVKFTALHSEKVTDIDGNIYATVKIGSQVWMTENLKVSHYRNGDPITYVTDNAEWASQDGSYSGYGAYCWNKNNITYKDVFGALYNGYAVFDNRNIAPQGWHIPTLVEWQTLFNYLGGDKIANGKLKEIGTLHWDNPNSDATNETCFNGLPTGGRNKSTGIFSDNWRTGGYWTCTETNWDNSASWVAVLFNDPNTNPNPAQTWGCSKAYGQAVRCVKDL